MYRVEILFVNTNIFYFIFPPSILQVIIIIMPRRIISREVHGNAYYCVKLANNMNTSFSRMNGNLHASFC